MYIMPDYRKAVIYKLETGDDLYVGSTCNFAQRKYKHNLRINFKDTEIHCTNKLYNTIRENGEWKMTPIKEFPCESKLQLTIEEEKCRKELGATLNSQCCGTGIDCQDEKQYNKHYRLQNREKLQQYEKERREQQNKEQIREYMKQYYQDNKEKITEDTKQYREQNKEQIRERNKQYHQNNKEKISERNKQYHQNNKEKILERNNQKNECPICGSVVARIGMARHKRSAKCKAHI